MSDSAQGNTSTDHDTVRVYIRSDGIETMPVASIDAASGKTVTRHYVYGSINGQAFQLACDEPVDVSPDIAAVLQPLIIRQNSSYTHLEIATSGLRPSSQ